MPNDVRPIDDMRETRALVTGLELRSVTAQDSGPGTAEGYAVLFNSETDVCGCFTEVIAPGAFAKSLQERDVIAIHSHDTGRVMGRKGAGTLELKEDAKGLSFSNPLPDTNDGRDLAVQLQRGDIAGMSFGFIATRQEWDDTVEPPRRTIHEAMLFEITYTALPQYDETEVGLRSLDKARQEKRNHNKTGASGRIAKRMRLAQRQRKI